MKRLQFVEDTTSDCGCRNHCLDKFSTEDKVALIDSLYNGRPKTEFDLYLMDMITRNEVRRKRPRKERDPDSNNNPQRQCSFSYSALRGAQKVAVCRRAFVQLHALSHKAVSRLTGLLAHGHVPHDSARRQAARAVPSEAALQIDKHIRSFPGHYIERPVTYLGAQLTVRTMYKLFCIRYPDLKEAVNYECYLKYFKEHYCYRHRDIET